MKNKSDLISWDGHQLLHTFNEKWKGGGRMRKEGIGAHLPKAETNFSIEEMFHINMNRS